jgi:hypothetical protein
MHAIVATSTNTNLYYEVSILLRYDVMPLGIWLLMSQNMGNKLPNKMASYPRRTDMSLHHCEILKLTNLYYLGITTPSDTTIPTFMPSFHALGLYPYKYFITNPLIIQKNTITSLCIVTFCLYLTCVLS